MVRYEVEAAVPPESLAFDLSDPEPAQVVAFPASHGSDARYFRAFAFKPTVEGQFSLTIAASLDGFVVASVTCPGVLVVP
jgi:hypothetical protein